MQQHQLALNFANISEILNKNGLLCDAAEIHGMLCGLMCVSRQVSYDAWMSHVIGVEERPEVNPVELSTEATRYFLLLYEQANTQLGDDQFEFQLLLPDDDETLQERTEALSHWCQGFLFGLGLGGLDDFTKASDIVTEICRDIMEVSKAEDDTLEPDADDEKAYFELTEFVRMAVILLYEELSINSNDESRLLH